MFLAVFTAELALCLYVQQLGFLESPADILDALIVFMGWFFKVTLPAFFTGEEGGNRNTKSLQPLKVIRCFRCVRVLRITTMLEDLYLIVLSFFFRLHPFTGTVLFISTIIFIFAALTAELIG